MVISEAISLFAHSIKENTLVTYKGGGYDGCSWEWNMGLIDDEGQFHSIYESGYNGIEDLETLLTRYNDWREALSRESRKMFVDRDEFDLYDMDQPFERARLCQQMPVDWLEVIGKWFAENRPTVELLCKCDSCKEFFDLVEEDSYGTNQSGAGGVMITSKEIVCNTCYSSGTCAYCSDYVGPWVVDDENGYCPSCLEEHKAGDL